MKTLLLHDALLLTMKMSRFRFPFGVFLASMSHERIRQVFGILGGAGMRDELRLEWTGLTIMTRFSPVEFVSHFIIDLLLDSPIE